MLQRQYIFIPEITGLISTITFEELVVHSIAKMNSQSVSFNNNIRENGHAVTEGEVGDVKHVLASR